MKIGFASDHAAIELRTRVASFVRTLGHEVVDLGAFEKGPSDYPDHARAAVQKLLAGEVERIILFCGTGQGMAMTANHHEGVRCAVCSDVFSARMSRAHNDANALALGARVVAEGLAREIVGVWLEAQFEGGRHVARVAKISASRSATGKDHNQ